MHSNRSLSFSLSVNALIAFPPRRFSRERRRRNVKRKKKKRGGRHLAEVGDEKFDALCVCVCARLIDKYKHSKRPYESQITKNFHRSLLCVSFSPFLVTSEPFHLQCVYDTLGRIKSHFCHTLHYTLFVGIWDEDNKNERRRKKSRRRAQTINKNEALHGEHPFIFRNILLIVSFYLLFGPFLLAATKIWHFCFIFHIYTKWHWHLSSASSVPDDKRRWRKTTLLHIDVNGRKKLNGKVPRKRFSKDCDAKKGKWIPFQTATTTAATKNTELSNAEICFRSLSSVLIGSRFLN